MRRCVRDPFARASRGDDRRETDRIAARALEEIRRLAQKVDDDPPAPTPRERDRATRERSAVSSRATARGSENEDPAKTARKSNERDVRQRLEFSGTPTPSTPRSPERRGTQGARGERGGKTSGNVLQATTARSSSKTTVVEVKSPERAYELESRAEAERALREETVKLREALEEAERKAKSSASIVLELQERVRELREENVGEARVLSRMEAQLRRREHEFEAQREVMSSQLEAAIFSANERDNEALARDQEAREELRAAKLAASQYVLNDTQRRFFWLKAGWCARYFHLMLALELAPACEDVEEEATVWTSAFGIELNASDSHAQIAKKIDDVLIDAAKKPVASYEVDNSLQTSSFNLPGEEPHDDLNDTPVEEPGPTHTSLPPSLNQSWPKNFRDALNVEIAMRHLTACRIEERVIVSLADARRARVMTSLSRSSSTADESNALGEEEIHEFHFRRAWLRFMWAHAREAGMDPGVADERENNWVKAMQTMTGDQAKSSLHVKRDALAVDKGLKELRQMLIETRLSRTV